MKPGILIYPLGDNFNVDIEIKKGAPQVPILDIDGNEYNYVNIGTQQWLVQNLRTTKYADGTSITNLLTAAEWRNANEGYCWENNNIANKDIFGAYYNLPAVINPRGLAPAGWRVPSIADMNTLLTFLGGNAVAGGKLKEKGTSHWLTTNVGATDTYGFKAIPTGGRTYYGEPFNNNGQDASWWTSYELYDGLIGIWFNIQNSGANLNYNPIAYDFGYYGRTIRCMRDLTP
jgi:uncharacterized protein (TIGR02145 family)